MIFIKVNTVEVIIDHYKDDQGQSLKDSIAYKVQKKALEKPHNFASCTR